MKKRVGTIDCRPAPGVLFEQALSLFEEAVRHHHEAGAYPPQDRPEVHKHYERKKKALTDYVVALEKRLRDIADLTPQDLRYVKEEASFMREEGDQ